MPLEISEELAERLARIEVENSERAPGDPHSAGGEASPDPDSNVPNLTTK
jgi:hypothetical protein